MNFLFPLSSLLVNSYYLSGLWYYPCSDLPALQLSQWVTKPDQNAVLDSSRLFTFQASFLMNCPITQQLLQSDTLTSKLSYILFPFAKPSSHFTSSRALSLPCKYSSWQEASLDSSPRVACPYHSSHALPKRLCSCLSLLFEGKLHEGRHWICTAHHYVSKSY